MPGRDAVAGPDDSRHLERLRGLARVWDDLVRIPVIGRRIGLDAVVGLIPGVGDVAGALVASWGLVIAATLRAPASILGRMVVNIGIDALLGVVPLLGDLFDIGWKAQRRNLRLLEQWMDDPGGAVRSSTLTLVAIGLTLGAVFVGSIWLAVRLVVWLLSLA